MKGGGGQGSCLRGLYFGIRLIEHELLGSSYCHKVVSPV